MEETDRSLSKWRLELKANKKVWGTFYAHFIGKPPSSYPRLYKVLQLYGEWALFEAIIDSSSRTLDPNQDPLNYVSVVAKKLWIESQKEEEHISDYVKAIEDAKKKTRERNKKLTAKLHKNGVDRS